MGYLAEYQAITSGQVLAHPHGREEEERRALRSRRAIHGEDLPSAPQRPLLHRFPPHPVRTRSLSLAPQLPACTT